LSVPFSVRVGMRIYMSCSHSTPKGVYNTGAAESGALLLQ